MNLSAYKKRPGNYDYSEYMLGYLNGMILFQAILLKTEPDFMKAPTKYINEGDTTISADLQYANIFAKPIKDDEMQNNSIQE